MKRTVTLLVLIGALLLSVTAPSFAGRVSAAPDRSHAAAIHTRSHTAAFDKTRFVAHLAVAAFLVHYIYKKYKQGKLGRLHLFTDLKAAAAGLIAYHELKVAYGIAKTSNSKTLQAIISPLNALTGSVSAMASKLKHGDTSSVATVDSQQNGFQSLAGKNGFSYQDQQPAGFSGF